MMFSGKGFRRKGFWPGKEDVCALNAAKDGTLMFATDERFFVGVDATCVARSDGF